MTPTHPLETLVAATHTPFDDHGALHLSIVERQAEHLLRTGVDTVFIGGTTGEFSSLSTEERLALTTRWGEVAAGSPLRVVVHVGSTRIDEAQALARHAASQGAVAISALAPFYVKPRSVEDLIAVCAAIASAAPDLPFYFYDIPVLTGVHLPMPEFLTRARDRIPNLVGLKFTNPDLIAYQSCQRAGGGSWDLPWGIDECLLAALAVGARGAVGSGYNFAGPLYRRLLAAFRRGDLVVAREEQYRGVQVVETLARRGYMASAKAVMRHLGVDVGPVRAPLPRLESQQETALLSELDQMGFWDWVAVGKS